MIQAAAQLKVQWSDPPAISGSGNLWKWMRERTPPARRRPASRRRPAESVDAAMKSAAKTYSGTFTLPLPDACSDRPERRRRGRDEGQRDHLHARQERLREHAAADRGGAEHRDPVSTYDIDRVRVIYYEGASSFGGGAQHVDVGEARRSCRSAVGARSGSSSCAGTSTAGTTTARRRCGTSRAASTRTARSSRSTPRASAWASYNKTPTESAGRPADGDARQRPRRHDVLGDAVRHPEPPDHRQDHADAQQRVQDVDAACAERARRRASPTSR